MTNTERRAFAAVRMYGRMTRFSPPVRAKLCAALGPFMRRMAVRRARGARMKTYEPDPLVFLNQYGKKIHPVGTCDCGGHVFFVGDHILSHAEPRCEAFKAIGDPTTVDLAAKYLAEHVE